MYCCAVNVVPSGTNTSTVDLWSTNAHWNVSPVVGSTHSIQVVLHLPVESGSRQTFTLSVSTGFVLRTVTSCTGVAMPGLPWGRHSTRDCASDAPTSATSPSIDEVAASRAGGAVQLSKSLLLITRKISF